MNHLSSYVKKKKKNIFWQSIFVKMLLELLKIEIATTFYLNRMKHTIN